MGWSNTHDRYGALSIGMHWLTLALLVGVYACINLHGAEPKGSALRAGFKTWHAMLGLSVFALVWLRLAIRFVTPSPGISPEVHGWQRQLAGLMHGVLYAFLIVMPILGWTTWSAGGDAVPFFGLTLPPLVAPDPDLESRVKAVHETIGVIGYYLIGLHAAGALYHHYFLHDDTLRRMWPRRRGAGSDPR